jgi:hypothetical protein
VLSGELPEDFENKKDRRGFDDWYSADETALKHLAVKNFVLFLTGRAGRPDATSHQQSCADRDQNSRPIGLELEEPTCEGVKM